MEYSQFLKILSSFAEEKFAEFQRRLIFTKYQILGVRTPKMREIAKQYADNFEEIFSFPNEYYEVVFIKLTMVSYLPYKEFLHHLDECVSLMDNWALCDCFKAKCIKKNKKEFLPVLEGIFRRGGEYEQRYPLVTLLYFYVEKDYLPILQKFIAKTNTKPYYAYMAVSWLVAEILVKEYDFGIEFLKSRIIDEKTHNKSIQKAIESYRLTNEQKEFLRSLKIKNK